MDKRLTDIPEKTEITSINIIPVALEQPERDVVTFRRPAFTMIVTVFENKMTATVDPFNRLSTIMLLDFTDIVCIVVIKYIDSAGWNFEHHCVGIFHFFGHFLNWNRNTPRFTIVSTAHGSYMLASCAFVTGTSG
jgi:hypothetical protein